MRGFGYARTTQCAVRWRLGDDLCDVLNLRAVRGRSGVRVARESVAVRELCAGIGRFQGCLLRWASGPWENQQAYFLLPRRNRSTPACSTTRGRSDQGPGTRPGQALPLCTHGRTEGSSTTTRGRVRLRRAVPVGRNSGINGRASIRDHGAHRATSSDTRRLRLGDIIGYFVFTSEPLSIF
ncbi:hypothetical protein HPB50_024635 [Hyalomma asiaticum]|uniref:Uncharacterized protein n=1 Tax=Hyalomma asiaticum TaxID=266040 RepID=A0ACB7SZJ2_HYAAI|nr:hypothetical protein HPB50_024635 [Hyalomma asiaticum]